MTAIFSEDPSRYKRDLDPIKRAKEVYAQAIYKKNMQYGVTYEKALDWVEKESVDGGKMGMNEIPTKIVYYDHEEKGGDRDFKVTTWSQYLKEIRQRNLIVAPSGTVFLNHKQRNSPLNEYISTKKKNRSVYKKRMFVAKMKKDVDGITTNDSLQKAMKTDNNALSGTVSLSNNPIYAESIHPVLTSLCRTGTSHANWINERFIVGNRHYWHPFVAKNDILVLSLYCDRVAVKNVMDKYGLVVPTYEYLVENVLKRNTEPYFDDKKALQEVIDYIYTLDDIERVFYAYHLDLFTLENLNKDFVKEFILRSTSTQKPDTSLTKDQCDELIHQLHELQEIAISIFCKDQTKGVLRNEWENDLLEYQTIATTAREFIKTMEYYSDMINTFWNTDLLPTSIYELPNIRRKCVLGGDTDSTLYTAWYWGVKEKFWSENEEDHFYFNDGTRNIATLIVYFSGAITAHVLRQVSKNIGTVDEHLSTLTMKNEFFFPTFVLTGRAKHYYTNREIEEGNFKPEADLEIKGVHLRSSEWPEEVRKDVEHLVKYVTDASYNNRSIKLESIFNEISIYENMIIKGLEIGDSRFLSGFKITDGTANAIHMDFWETVFENKYGKAEGRNIRSLKVPVNMDKPEKMKQWIESINDGAIRRNLELFVKKYRKETFTFMAIPDTIISSSGIPKEILPIANVEAIFDKSLAGFYMILESLNIYVNNRHGEYVYKFFPYDLHKDRILDPKRSIEILGNNQTLH